MYNLDLRKHSPISTSMGWIYEILYIKTWNLLKQKKKKGIPKIFYKNYERNKNEFKHFEET